MSHTVGEDQTIENWSGATHLLVKLLIEDGLYTSIDLTTVVGKVVRQMIDDDIYAQFDLYCPTCSMVTPYLLHTVGARNPATASRYTLARPKPTILILNATCQRVSHHITFVLHDMDSRLKKIGQTPSLADISLGELKTIQRGLEPQDRKEMGRALGLFSHDAPLGAFVYLRRVFERMILRAHQRHIDAGLPAVEGFGSMRMENRIDAIRDQLPEKVVRNRRVFAVLSIGIHELSDEDAGELFPLLKTVIFQMLGDEERLRTAREQEAATDAAFAGVLSRLTGPVQSVVGQDALQLKGPLNDKILDDQ